MNVKFDEIVSIEECDEEETLDIQVSGDNLFFANGILTHNCGVNNMESDMTTVSESMGLPATADAMFDISQTEEDKELGIVRLGMMKNRFGPNFGKVALRVDWNTLDIYEDSNVNAVESTLETYSALEKFNQS